MNCIVVSGVPNTCTIVRLIESFVQCGDIKSVDVLSTERNGCNQKLGLDFTKYKIIFQSSMDVTKLFEIIEAPIDGYYMVLDELNDEPMEGTFSSTPSSRISTPSTINNNSHHNMGRQENGMRSYVCNTPVMLERSTNITENEYNMLPSYEDTLPRSTRNHMRVPEVQSRNASQRNDGLGVLRIEIFSNTILDRRRKRRRGGLISTILSLVAEPNESQNFSQGRGRGRCGRY